MYLASMCESTHSDVMCPRTVCRASAHFPCVDDYPHHANVSVRFNHGREDASDVSKMYLDVDTDDSKQPALPHNRISSDLFHLTSNRYFAFYIEIQTKCNNLWSSNKLLR